MATYSLEACGAKGRNGIIENFAELRGELEAGGGSFASETDTVNLSERHFSAEIMSGIGDGVAEERTQPRRHGLLCIKKQKRRPSGAAEILIIVREI